MHGQEEIVVAHPGERSMEFVDHPELHDERRLQRLLAGAEGLADARGAFPSADEPLLFKALHGCVFAVQRTRGGRDPAQRHRLIEVHERLVDYLVRRNIGLVYDMRRHSRITNVHPDDLNSEGSWTLFQAVKRFDPWRGFRFSTYACTSILRAYLLLSRRRQQQLERCEFLHEDLVTQARAGRRDGASPARPLLDHLKDALRNNSAGLTSTERFVIEQRLLHPPSNGPETLESVGKLLRLSKERIRQIQELALRKLRKMFINEERPARSAGIGRAVRSGSPQNRSSTVAQ